MVESIAIVEVFVKVVGADLEKQAGEQCSQKCTYIEASLISRDSGADEDRTDSGGE